MAPAPRRRGQCAGARRESRRAGAAAGVVPWAAESAAARGVPGTGRDERGRGRPLGVAAGAQLRVRLQCPSDPPAVLVVLCKWLPGLPEASLGRGLPWAAPGPASDGQRQRVADGSQRPEVAEFCPQLRLGAAVPGWGSGRTCALAACPLARGFPVSVSPRGSQALRRVWVGWVGRDAVWARGTPALLHCHVLSCQRCCTRRMVLQECGCKGWLGPGGAWGGGTRAIRGCLSQGRPLGAHSAGEGLPALARYPVSSRWWC